ncbi:hypothetical protein C7B77_15615 [Chamaesiphon polymorphus CCALA 037]|uniref:Uncharacterized protein n=1 Tax=Chamaesiphon polymorphus CCALA 037 TaxID=2107692 RepID=A0A2T1GCW4_9CYAN|nr:hypothetical protein C7B77_15615 [Chamaesiphon polymorphus CCALA 037]
MYGNDRNSSTNPNSVPFQPYKCWVSSVNPTYQKEFLLFQARIFANINSNPSMQSKATNKEQNCTCKLKSKLKNEVSTATDFI